MDLLDKIGRLRALDDDESALLERIVRRQCERERRSGNINRRTVPWTPEADALVLQSASAADIAHIAHITGASRSAVYMRRFRLRRSS